MVAKTANGKKAEPIFVGEEFILALDERIALLGVLPRQGDLITLRIIRDLQQELAPTEEEIKEADLRNTGAGMTWNSMKAKAITKAVTIGDKGKELLAEGINNAGKQKQLDAQWLELYERFVPIEE